MESGELNDARVADMSALPLLSDDLIPATDAEEASERMTPCPAEETSPPSSGIGNQPTLVAQPADQSLEDGSSERSALELESLLREHPLDDDLYRGYVDTVPAGSRDRAVKTLLQLAREDKSLVGPYYGLALVAARAGKLETTHKYALLALRRRPDHAPTLALLTPEAAEQLTATARRFNALDGLMGDLEAKAKEGLFEIVLTELRTVIEKTPAYFRAQFLYFSVCERKRDVAAAQQMAQRLGGSLPRNIRLGPLLAKVLLAAGNHVEALTECASSLVEFPRLREAADLALRILRNNPGLCDWFRGSVAAAVPVATDPSGLKGLLGALEEKQDQSRPAAGDELLRTAREEQARGHGTAAAQAYRRWAEAAPSHTRYLEAALAVEGMGEYCPAINLYNHAIKYKKNCEEAKAGLLRIEAARKELSGQKAEHVPDYRGLGERKLEQGEYDSAVGYLMVWAEKIGTADAFVEVARLFESHGQRAYALQLCKGALRFDANHATALEMLGRPRFGQSSAQRASVEQIDQWLDGDPGQAVAEAAALVAKWGASEPTLEAVALLRRIGVGQDLAWLPEAGPGAALVRWIYGVLGDEQLTESGVGLAEAQEWAGRLAMYEHRWEDARRFYLASGGIKLALAHFGCGDLSAALAVLPSLDEILTVTIDPEIPSCSNLSATAVRPANELLLRKAWHECQAGQFEDAAFHYRLIGQAPGSQMPWAKLNEALCRLRLGQFIEAERILAEIYEKWPHYSNFAWARALAAVKAGNDSAALEALRYLLSSVDENHGNARVLLTALLARAGNFDEAITQLSEKPKLLTRRDPAILLIRCAERVGPDCVHGAFELILQRHEYKVPSRHGAAPVPSAGPALARSAVPASQPARPTATMPAKLTGPQLKVHVRNLRSQSGMAAAYEYLQRYVKHYPGFTPARLELGRLFFEDGRFELAEGAFQLACKTAKNNTAQALIELARVYLELARPREALAALGRCKPEEFEVRPQLRADVEELSRRAAEAITGKRAAAPVREPQQPAEQNYLSLAALLENSALDPDVIARCERFAQSSPKKESAAVDTARRNFKKFIKTDPGRALKAVCQQRVYAPHASGLIQLHIEALDALGENEKAVSLAEAMVERDGQRDNRLLLARLYARMDRRDKEHEQYGYLLLNNPFDPEVHELLASAPTRLPCRISDPVLLKTCWTVFSEHTLPLQMSLYEQLRTRGATDETIQIAQILAEKQPDVKLWQYLVAELTPTGFATPAPAPAAPAVPAGRPVVATAVPAAPVSIPVLTPEAAAARREEVWRDLFENGAPELYLATLDKLCPRVAALLSPGEAQPRMKTLAVRETLLRLVDRVGHEAAYLDDDQSRLALLVEVAYVFRLLARTDRWVSTSHWPEKAQQPIINRYQTWFLANILKSLAALAPAEADRACHEAFSIADATLPRFYRQLRSLCGSLRKLAAHLLELRREKTLRNIKQLANRALSYCADLRNPTGYHKVPTGAREAAGNLARLWEAEVRKLAFDEERTARLKAVVSGCLPGGSPGEFVVALLLKNEQDVTASDIVVKVRNSGVEIGPYRKHTAGRDTQEVSLRFFGVPETRRAVELEGEIRYKAMQTLDDVCELAKVLTPPWVTPREIGAALKAYVVGPAVKTHDPSYTPRPKLLRDIEVALRPGQRANVVALYGLRRVGKSTLLNHLLKNPPEGDFPYFFDCQALSLSDYKTGDVVEGLARGIWKAVQSLGADLPFPTISQWRSEPTRTLDAVLEAARPVLAQHRRRVLFLVDEFEALLRKTDRDDGSVDPGLLGRLRGLMQHEDNLAFVIVGANQLLEKVGDYHAPLFNLMYPIQVNFLSSEESEALIRNPVAGVVDYDPAAVDELIRVSNGHPLLLQTLCFDLMRHLWAEGRDSITLLDVKHVIINQVKQEGHNHRVFPELFSKLGLTDSQKLLLAVIADLTERPDSCCPEIRIEEQLSDLECSLLEGELFTDLGKLVRMNLLRQERRPDQSFEYRVSIPLFGDWLRVYQKVETLAGAVRERLPYAAESREAEEFDEEWQEGERA
jgi:tetratricopeptide (TPR) repeat protein